MRELLRKEKTLRINLFNSAVLPSKQKPGSYPTIRFIRWRRHIKADRAPTVTASEYSIISTSLVLQLCLLLAMLLSASLMANGVLR